VAVDLTFQIPELFYGGLASGSSLAGSTQLLFELLLPPLRGCLDLLVFGSVAFEFLQAAFELLALALQILQLLLGVGCLGLGARGASLLGKQGFFRVLELLLQFAELGLAAFGFVQVPGDPFMGRTEILELLLEFAEFNLTPLGLIEIAGGALMLSAEAFQFLVLLHEDLAQVLQLNFQILDPCLEQFDFPGILGDGRRYEGRRQGNRQRGHGGRQRAGAASRLCGRRCGRKELGRGWLLSLEFGLQALQPFFAEIAA